jgi:imidazolonepropionase-like amidohydrolase
MNGLRRSRGRTGYRFIAAVAGLWLAGATPALAQTTPAVLFQNVRIFDGTGAALSPPSNVLVRGNTIAQISTATIVADDAGVIDGGGRVLMPGLIDAHWHAMFAGLSPLDPMANDPGYSSLAAAAQANATLMRGFTTVRDLGGPVFPLKRAIDEGLIVGPRIYPSGAMITTTGGHGDLRPLTDVPRAAGGPLSVLEQTGVIGLADSAHEVRMRAREQFMQGASQLKLMGSGGVSSPRTPLDMATFTEPELHAGVEVADNWNTYVTVHAYTPRTIRRAIDAGARCIEHAHLMDDATAKLMADKGVWLSIQPFTGDGDSVPLTGQSRINQLEVIAGTDHAYRLAKQYKIRTAFGSDLLFSAALAERQGAMLARLTTWYTPAEALKMATADNAELLALSGPRNPYPGKLGVVAEGALADLLLVDGNPLENMALIENPAKSFVVIMKDGTVFKNALAH